MSQLSVDRLVKVDIFITISTNAAGVAEFSSIETFDAILILKVKDFFSEEEQSQKDDDLVESLADDVAEHHWVND